MSATYINPALPSMIRNLYRDELEENSIQTMLDLAADLVQELVEIRAEASRKPEAAPATPVSGTDEVFDILDELNASNQICYDDYLRLHDAVSRASQPVQVEVTEEMLERAARVLYDNYASQYDIEPWALTRVQEQFLPLARAALSAALGGGERWASSESVSGARNP